ncbi:MAG: hypothetical protein ABID40_05780 [Candidatus Bipolaricaulota bacterium]
MTKWITFVLVLAWGGLALAQSALTDFPLGVTSMTWTTRGTGSAPPQELTLTVEGKPGNLYRIELLVAAEGTAADLGTLGFLGSALFVQASGAMIDLSALQVLTRRRDTLKVGEQYALPGGTFHARAQTDIAGVACLVGEYRAVDRPNTVTEIGFALTDPVYFLPLMRVQDGGKVTFEMVLTAYRRP